MGDCSYCEKKAGWAKSVHKECKIEHYESSSKRLDSGVGLKASAGKVTSLVISLQNQITMWCLGTKTGHFELK
jgi:hypothetical protein